MVSTSRRVAGQVLGAGPHHLLSCSRDINLTYPSPHHLEMWSCRQNVVRRHLCPSSPSPHGRVLCCCNKTYLEKLCRGIDLTWGGVAAVTYSLQGCQREFVKFHSAPLRNILGVNGKYIDVKLDTNLQRSYRRLTKLHDGPSPGIVKFREVPLRALLVSTDSPPCPTFRTVHWCRLQLPLWLHPS